ncbi:MAG: hypothetical protein COB74_00400 [Shewanella sp.]|nr:MAG: hypothetical protein COB74_00400 [Shewanella sp.]
MRCFLSVKIVQDFNENNPRNKVIYCKYKTRSLFAAVYLQIKSAGIKLRSSKILANTDIGNMLLSE